jgi:hypothetical protein
MAIGLCAVWSARGEQRIGTPPRGHGPRRLLCFLVFRIGLPHRTGCRPLIIHLCGPEGTHSKTDQLRTLRSATQNRTKVPRPATIDPMPVPPGRPLAMCRCVRPPRTYVHNMASGQCAIVSPYGVCVLWHSARACVSKMRDTPMLAMRAFLLL